MSNDENQQQQVHIRLPADLHAELVKRARAQGVSFNALIKILLFNAVDRSKRS